MSENTTGFVFVVMAAVGILIGLAFLPSISPEIGKMTQTFTSINVTMTMPAASSTSELTMCGQEARSYVLTNATNPAGVVPTTNYTVSSSAGSDGYLAAKITTASQSAFAGRSVNVTCTYEPKGYIDDSGSRAIVALVAIAFALLIVVAAIPNLRDKLFDAVRS